MPVLFKHVVILTGFFIEVKLGKAEAMGGCKVGEIDILRELLKQFF
jgi:hypothetical protein